MKLKKLEIRNIASIEHAVIDFSAAPLDGEHLFLITGETGAGKSTIIDCLCLALYGDTPRLSHAKKAEYENNRNDEKLKTNDVKQLLRRGAVSADVSLTFDDNNGIPHTATWHVHRARMKTDGNIIGPERVIKTDDGVTTNPVYKTKKTEIEEYVEELIGLRLNEFFRTVVLAQGRFAEFLNSDETDKATLLEKMTGTEVYTQIGVKIHEVEREKKAVRDNLLGQLQNITLLNDDEKAEITGEMSRLRDELAGVNQQRDQAKKMADWLDKKAQIEKTLAEKRQYLAAKQAETQKPDFIEQQRLVKDWESTAEPRRELRDRLVAQTQIESLLKKQPALQEEFDGLCAALRAMVSGVKDMEQQLAEVDAYLNGEQPNKEMYKAIKSIKSHLSQRKTEQDNIKEFTTALNKDKEMLPGVEQTHNDTLKAYKELESSVNALQERYDGIGVADIMAKKDALTDAARALTALSAERGNLANAVAAVEGLEKERGEEWLALEKERAAIDDKRALKEQAANALSREKDWNTLIEQAHLKLKPGERCPVCGETIKELKNPSGQDVLIELEKQLAQAEQNVIQAEGRIAASKKLVQRLDQQITSAKQSLDERKAALEKQWNLTRVCLAKCGRQATEMPDEQVAQALATSINEEEERLNISLQQANELHLQIKAERVKLDKSITAHNEAKIHLNKINDSIKYQTEAINDSIKRFDAHNSELDVLLTIPDWQQQADGNEGFIGGLEKRAADYQQKEEDAQRLRDTIKLNRAIIPAMEENKSNIEGLTDHHHTCDKVPAKLDEWWRQFENKCIQWNNDLANERRIVSRAQQALDSYLSAHDGMTEPRLAQLNRYDGDSIHAIKGAQQALMEAIIRAEGEIASLVEQQGDIQRGKPDFIEENRDKLDEILKINDEKCERLTSLIADLKARLKTDEENLRLVGEKKAALEEAEAVYGRWADFSVMLGSADGAKFRRIAQSYILGELLHSANGYLRRFNDRYELVASPGKLVILVRDLLQGDLTSVNTLSGGESFMVSLALALALSSTMGRVFTVDTLFIDEGFGSLSENYLDNVIETLNRLYEIGERRVGIISHVEALKERITTQIQVYRDAGNNTVSRVNVVS